MSGTCRCSDLPCGRRQALGLLGCTGSHMPLPTDDAVVDPWVVLRRLMAENRELRAERDALHARIDELESQLARRPGAEEAAPSPDPDVVVAEFRAEQPKPAPGPSAGPVQEHP